MTREEIKEMLPIMQAFAEGKQIQFFKGDKWVDMEYPNFSEEPCLYRIKPEPKYRPFKSVEECWEEMQKHQPFGWVKNDKGTYLCITIITNTIENLKDKFNKFKFIDDSLFGIKEEQL